MRLAEFIRENNAPIVREWESFARTLEPASASMTPVALRNHIEQMLEFIADDMEAAQTTVQQFQKSRGEKPRPPYPSAAETHASLRHAGGFNIDQMVSEYRSLRASVIKLWGICDRTMTASEAIDMVRFNESIDQAMTESIHDYSSKMEASRNLFLGILSHDLRNPLSAITMSAHLAAKIGQLSPNQSMLIEQIANSADRAGDIVTALLDLTRARLGSGLPLIKLPVDMAYVSKLLVDEARASHPDRIFSLVQSGNLEGVWDRARIGQVFSNLIGNAVQYGFADAPIAVAVDGFKDEVVISVHNEGVPIAPEHLKTIFDALTRVEPAQGGGTGPLSVNLGLGLYICKEIVTAHGGHIDVTSTEKAGTTFT
ncbi:MAG: sensor histidine kinase, partial [Asticcacaulis sp.]